MKVKNIFKISEDRDSLGNKFRNNRFNFFFKKINSIKKPINILDLGGKINYWENRGLAGNSDFRITILNLELEISNYLNIKNVMGNACDLNEYDDNSFDIVHSNSVIEHLNNFENQKQMALEAQRVGVKHIIQTPNKFFFIEPHYLIPFFQYLPKDFQFQILTKTKISRLKKWDKKFAKQYTEEIRLISFSEFKKIFPNSKIYFEKFLWMNKSFTAHNFY